MKSFEIWWEREGSKFSPLPGEDAAEHTRRVCEIAWSNAVYVTNFYGKQNQPARPETYSNHQCRHEMGG